jgi:hypothetical protein
MMSPGFGVHQGEASASSTHEFRHDKGSQRRDQGLGPTQCVLVEAVADPRTVHGAPNETRLFEDLQMLRDRRLRQRKLVHDLPAETLTSSGEEPKDLHPGRVAECLGEPGKFLIGLGALDRA